MREELAIYGFHKASLRVLHHDRHPREKLVLGVEVAGAVGHVEGVLPCELGGRKYLGVLGLSIIV